MSEEWRGKIFPHLKWQLVSIESSLAMFLSMNAPTLVFFFVKLLVLLQRLRVLCRAPPSGGESSQQGISSWFASRCSVFSLSSSTAGKANASLLDINPVRSREVCMGSATSLHSCGIKQPIFLNCVRWKWKALAKISKGVWMTEKSKHPLPKRIQVFTSPSPIECQWSRLQSPIGGLDNLTLCLK